MSAEHYPTTHATSGILRAPADRTFVLPVRRHVERNVRATIATVLDAAFATIAVKGGGIAPGGKPLMFSGRPSVTIPAGAVVVSKAYDAVIDFDAVIRDPANPTKFLPTYDSGDHLHPNDAGYEAMGNAVDLKLFTAGR